MEGGCKVRRRTMHVRDDSLLNHVADFKAFGVGVEDGDEHPLAPRSGGQEQANRSRVGRGECEVVAAVQPNVCKVGGEPAQCGVSKGP
eukprot:2909553-Prymnesium_polylepis.1